MLAKGKVVVCVFERDLDKDGHTADEQLGNFEGSVVLRHALDL